MVKFLTIEMRWPLKIMVNDRHQWHMEFNGFFCLEMESKHFGF